MEPALTLHATLPHPVPSVRARAPRATRLYDRWGLGLTSSSREAVEAYEQAVLSLLGHRADTLSHVEAALCADPGLSMAHVMRGFALRLLARRDIAPLALEALAQAERSQLERGSNLREALLMDALRAFCAGDVGTAIGSLARCAEVHPNCLVTLKLHHALCFMYGKPESMRRGLEVALLALDAELDGYGFALGCYAFALEETGSYAEAERTAREAIARCPNDAWGYHALLHVFTMQDRTREGLQFVRARGARFAGGNNFIAHIGWHHALFAIAEGQLEEALVLYDRELTQPLGRDYRDLANCASLLYRLERAGMSVGARWQPLADLAEQRIGDHTLAFADAHYVLSLLGAGRLGQAGRFVEALRQDVLQRRDADGDVQRRVGLPLVQGLHALWSGDAQDALQKLCTLGSTSLLLGGSHAQRELFTQLRADTALAAGQFGMAEQMLTRQLETRPGCAWAAFRCAEVQAAREKGARDARVQVPA